jgi:methionyl-tRNA formyltransferase
LLRKIRHVVVYNISDINSKEASDLFDRYAPSLILCNTGLISKATIESHPSTYLVNVHGSRLPKYRGVSNLLWALWDKEDVWVTVHRINHGIDEGDILFQERVLENTGDLLSSGKAAKLVDVLPAVAWKAIKLFASQDLQFRSQDSVGEPMMQYYSMHPVLEKMVRARN